MPKLRRVSGQEAVRALERLGFAQVRQLYQDDDRRAEKRL